MSSSQILGAAAGAVVGFYTGNPQLGMLTYSVVSGVGAYLDQPDNVGPRLDDLHTQMSVYGAPIPFEFGVNRHAGTIIWPRTLDAIEHEHSESSKGGPDNITYTYTMSCAVLVCEGPIAGIRRIWANKRLVYDDSVANTGATQDPAISGLRIYLGSETQTADPLIEAVDGPSPAYLGYAYVVFEDYDVTELGGRPPQWEFEVVSAASTVPPAPVNLGAGGVTLLYNGQLWSVSGTSIYVYSVSTGALLTTIALPGAGFSITLGKDAIGADLVWVGHSDSGWLSAGTCATPIDPLTYTVGASTDFGYTGAVSELGTVVWNASNNYLYGFTNNGSGSGALIYPGGATSGITVPSWIYHSLEMPGIAKIALAGYGNWLVIAGAATDSTLATVTNSAWGGSVSGHRIAYDVSRNRLYWACVNNTGVYTVDLGTYALSLLISTGTGVEGLHYNSSNDTIYIDNGTALESYDPDTAALISSTAGSGVLLGDQRGNSVDASSSEYYFVSENGSPGTLWKINISGRMVPEQVILGDIVAAICARAELTAADIDATQLTDLVDGYIVAHQMTARAAIEPLQQAYFFDAVESDDKIKFVKRGGSIAATIPLAERAAHEGGQDTPDHLSITRAFELELPAECDVEYPDVDSDHLTGNQYDRRITKDTKQKINLQLPIVMTGSKAKQIARVSLYQAWLNHSYHWTTTRKYAYLEPSDVVYLPTDQGTYAARIEAKRELPNGVIEWDGKMEDQAVYTQASTGASVVGYLPQTIFTPDTTVLALLDIPLLRDEDDNAGYYVAMGGLL